MIRRKESQEVFENMGKAAKAPNTRTVFILSVNYVSGWADVTSEYLTEDDAIQAAKTEATYWSEAKQTQVTMEFKVRKETRKNVKIAASKPWQY